MQNSLNLRWYLLIKERREVDKMFKFFFFFCFRGLFVWGGFWSEGDFCRRGVFARGGFCPVPIHNAQKDLAQLSSFKPSTSNQISLRKEQLLPNLRYNKVPVLCLTNTLINKELKCFLTSVQTSFTCSTSSHWLITCYISQWSNSWQDYLGKLTCCSTCGSLSIL